MTSIWRSAFAVVVATATLSGLGCGRNPAYIPPTGSNGGALLVAAPDSPVVLSTRGGADPLGIAHGDFTSDGKLDLVVASHAARFLFVLRGDGAGRFTMVKTVSTRHAGPSSLAAGDINRDGTLDALVLFDGAAGLMPFIGDGRGDLTAGASFGPGDASFEAQRSSGIHTKPRLRDLDRDGFLDAIAADKRGRVHTFIGQGDGSFRGAAPIAPAHRCALVSIGDLNRDRHADFVCSQGSWGPVIAPFLGDGSAHFRAHKPLTVDDSQPSEMVLADFDADGRVDIAVVHEGAVGGQSSIVTIARGQADASFSTAATHAVGRTPADLAAADLDGDGRVDLLVLNHASRSISVLKGRRAAAFGAAIDVPIGVSHPMAMSVGDFNGDKRPDVAVTFRGDGAGQQGVAVLLNASGRSAPASR